MISSGGVLWFYWKPPAVRGTELDFYRRSARASGWMLAKSRLAQLWAFGFDHQTDGSWSVTLPYWLLWLLLSFPALVALKSWLRGCQKPGCCPRCGYDLRATPDRCPECGAPSIAKEA
jgi:hypothetical protein